MITNPARFALLPVILLASPASVSAKAQIVPAVCEHAQVIAVYTARHPGKAVSDALLFDASRQAKDYSPSYASCYLPGPGGNDQITGYVHPVNPVASPLVQVAATTNMIPYQSTGK
jgi:hypothetical protein